jgi:hypothetical protein
VEEMKTSELQGPALDWAVAKCEGIDLFETEGWLYDHDTGTRKPYGPSTNWSQGGPIIERERIALCPGYLWEASKDFDAVGGDTDTAVEHGPTPLVAAMRCFVTSTLGEEVEIPEALK